LSTQYAFKSLDTTTGNYALNKNGGAGSIQGVNLHASIARLHWTIPDQDHLNMVRDELTAGSGIITFPYHCFYGSHDKTHVSMSMSDDISYSGSLIEKTFVTWVNKGTQQQDSGGADRQKGNELTIGPAYDANNTPYLNNSGARYCPLFQSLDV